MASTLNQSTREFLNISRRHLLAGAVEMAADDPAGSRSDCIRVPFTPDEAAMTNARPQAADLSLRMFSKPGGSALRNLALYQ